MGGFFGCVSRQDAVSEVFYGTDYHSHLGTHRGGIAMYDTQIGLQREIHNIENSPFRTKFEHVFSKMQGVSGIGCVSDHDPQPLLIKSHVGTYAICYTGFISNKEQLVEEYLSTGTGHFDAMTSGGVNSTELLSVLIDKKNSFAEGIQYVHSKIEGSANILILKDDGSIICARDKMGRLPMTIGKNENGYCVSFEMFAYQKLGYDFHKELNTQISLKIGNFYENEKKEKFRVKTSCL